MTPRLRPSARRRPDDAARVSGRRRSRTGGRAASAAAGFLAVSLALGLAPYGAAEELSMESSRPAPGAERHREAATDAARDWPRPPIPVPGRPAGGTEVPAGAGLDEAIRRSAPGAVLLLAPGVHDGPIVLDRPLALWGPREAVVRSNGAGHTITVTAPEVSLLGFTIEGSGRRFDQTDAAVCLRADRSRVEGLMIREALFGITAERVHAVRIAGNEIVGTGEPDLGLRGDGIRLWEVRQSEVTGNILSHGRDLVVWYSPGNRVVDNFVEWGRYGTHYMYSHHNHSQGNTYIGNLVGIFVMYSDSVEITGNRMAFSDPTGGLGLGVKESGGLVVRDNIMLRNESGIYLDTSPLQRHHENIVEQNQLIYCTTGVTFHRSETRNTFLANDFRGCGTPVRVGGGGDAAAVTWRRNYFDDYQGYDLDRDGLGDVPYELHRLSDQLTTRHEALQFFTGTPALGLVDIVGRVLPLLAPRILVHDPTPRVAPAAERTIAGR